MQALNYPTDYYQQLTAQYQQQQQQQVAAAETSVQQQQPTGLHSNVFVRNIPPEIDENALQQMFATYGVIEHTRLVKNKNTSGNNYGFVKYQTIEQAQLAISTMNSAQVGSQFLEVKLASYDSKESGGGISVVGADGNFLGTPSDNLYVRNLPQNYGETDLQNLFALYGMVQEVKMLHPGDSSRQGSALLRMSSREEAARAIEALHGKPLPGSAQAIVLRYADTEEEKARKRNTSNTTQSNGSNRYAPYATYDQQQQQQQQQQQTVMPQIYPGYDMYGYATTPTAGQVPEQVPGQATAVGYDQYGNWQATAANNGVAGTNYMLPQQYPAAGIPQQPQVVQSVPQQQQTLEQPAASQSVYVKNIPAMEKDECELFLYRKFSPLGAIGSIFIMTDKDSGKARGVGFVNFFDGNSANVAIQQLNGLKVEDKVLGVALQNSRKK